MSPKPTRRVVRRKADSKPEAKRAQPEVATKPKKSKSTKTKGWTKRGGDDPKSAGNGGELFRPAPASKRYTGKSQAKFADDPSEPDRCHGAKRDGTRCKKRSTFGRMVCELHGGAEGTGRPIKHGLYSMANTRLGPILERVREQVDMAKDLDETLAMACTLLQAAIDRYQELDTPGFRKAALKLFDDASQATEQSERLARLRELRALLSRGVSEDGAMGKMEVALERVQKFQNDYAKLELTANRVMNEKQLVAQFGMWLEVVAQEAGREVALAVASRVGLPRA